MTRSPSGATRVACIIGDPVTHSLSPAIHNAAFAVTGLDWLYVALPVDPARVPAAVEGLRALGIAGANVTMPHKQAVVPLLDEIDDAARRIGAVNTIVNRDGSLAGSNTDGDGFLRFLAHEASADPAGTSVLLLGSGGAARALAVALGDAGASVTVIARDPQKAAEVASLARGVHLAWDDRAAAARSSSIVINATAAGTHGEEILAATDLDPSSCVVDLIYGPARTPLIEAADAVGARAFDGLGMLVHQAALAFERWTGTAAPIEAMRDAANVALSARAEPNRSL